MKGESMAKNYDKKNVRFMLVSIITLLIGIYILGCLGSNNSDGNGGKVVTFSSYHEFEEDYNTSEGKYLSADLGDTIKITDTIRIIVYNTVSDFTVVEFISEPGKSETFEGDITNEFSVGDDIILIFHIIENEFGYEVIEETWGKDAPASSIAHA